MPLTGYASYPPVMQEFGAHWDNVNAALGGSPLVLPGGYARANLQDTFNAVTITEQSAGLARDNRDALLPPIREHLLAYRKAVIALFPKNSPLVQSLPSISPTRGATPDAVTLQGHWDGAQGKTLLSWTASANPDLARYAVRKCAGPRYKAADEQPIGDIAPGTASFEIADTPQPGATDCFKVYVVLTTGNEKGSNAVKVVRG